MSNKKLTYDELLEQNRLLGLRLKECEQKNKLLLTNKKELQLLKKQLKKANNKVHETSEILSAISENIPAYMAIVDANTLCYKFVNSKFLANIKKEKHEIIGKHISSVIGEKNLQFAMKHINIVRSGKPTFYSNSFKIANDNVYANVYYVPCYKKGKVTDIIVMTYDITKVKKSEKALKKAKVKAQESEQRFKALHNASFGGIGIHNKGKILDCNKGLSDMTGYSFKELIGMNGLNLIAEETQELVTQNIISGYELSYEALAQKKTGEKFPIRIIAKTIPYKGENVRVTEFRDITQQKKHEQNLLEQNEKYERLNEQLKITNSNLFIEKMKAEKSEEQLKLISDNFVNGMIYQVVTLDENKRQFTYLSEAVKRLYGCSPDDAKKNPDLIYKKIHPDHKHDLIEKEKEAIKNMGIFKTETKVINPDGSIRWSYLISKPRNINNVMYWDGLEVDITDRVKMEQELIEAKNRAEESERLKSAFLANMSHEIRTPMNSIIGFSQLLKENELDSEERNHYLEFITEGGQQLLTLISDILDLSKIDANQITLQLNKHNLNEIIDSLYNQFLVSNKNKDIKLKCKKNLENQLIEIETDSIRLKQIFSNLIENALKFTKKGEIEFGYLKEKDHFLFFVSDTGIGIDVKHFNKVFDRFSQINNDFSNTGSGTGLGLSIVKGLVKLLKGKIWVESELNKGSVFKFKIPH